MQTGHTAHNWDQAGSLTSLQILTSELKYILLVLLFSEHIQ